MGWDSEHENPVLQAPFTGFSIAAGVPIVLESRRQLTVPMQEDVVVTNRTVFKVSYVDMLVASSCALLQVSPNQSMLQQDEVAFGACLMTHIRKMRETTSPR